MSLSLSCSGGGRSVARSRFRTSSSAPAFAGARSPHAYIAARRGFEFDLRFAGLYLRGAVADQPGLPFRPPAALVAGGGVEPLFRRVRHGRVGPVAVPVGAWRIDHAGIVAGAAEEEAGLAPQQLRPV